MEQMIFNRPEYFENREESWLEFNQRVLDEAQNTENPLFERLKFLSIVSSNLDEFFMVRVASVKEQVNVGYTKTDYAGLTPEVLLAIMDKRIHRMVEEQSTHYKRALLPQLRKEGIFIKEADNLTDDEIEFVEEYFTDNVYPVLTPLAVDSGRPFPLILNRSLNIAALVKKDSEEMFATVQVPSVLPRYIQLPSGEGQRQYIMMESIIEMHLDKLFIGQDILCTSTYRITRDADLSLDEEDASDLLVEIEKSIKKRKWGEAIRLEYHKDMGKRLIRILIESLNLGAEDLYPVDGPLDLTFLMKLYGLKGVDHLKYPAFKPMRPKDLLGKEDMFEAIANKDIFLSHPYESFEPVVEWIQQAARDKRVLAIKQTLYRVSGQSPIIRALAEAAEAGKQVTVLVELKARFDEENNIQWARSLEQAGCHVIYGLVGLKTHSKVTLVVRKEDSGIKRYVHLGTGNYNDITARFYTDMGILTCNERIGADVSAVFNTLTGYSEAPKLHKIAMAPTGMREKFMMLIQREQAAALEGKPAKIIAKMNSLCDQEIIEALYQASSSGVEIELIVRGICSLIPGIPGVSDHITVRSIVGKYLEHSRIYYFYNRGQEEIYLSSADWMPRNLNRRVELMFPIESEEIRERIKAELDILMADVVKAKIKGPDKVYHRIDRRGKDVINVQAVLEQMARDAVEKFETDPSRDLFIPITSDSL